MVVTVGFCYSLVNNVFGVGAVAAAAVAEDAAPIVLVDPSTAWL